MEEVPEQALYEQHTIVERSVRAGRLNKTSRFPNFMSQSEHRRNCLRDETSPSKIVVATTATDLPNESCDALKSNT